MSKLSARQEALLKYLRHYIRENQYPPTYEEMQDALGFSSKSHVDYHLKVLAHKGYIEQEPGKSRGIRLTDKGWGDQHPMRPSGQVRLPIYGYIGASLPTWSATQNEMSPDEVITVTPDIVPRRDDLYGLRVRGDSMIDALVNDGDIVVVCPRWSGPLRNGTMVAARLLSSDETTLKHFYRGEGNTVRLVPANPHYRDIIVPLDDIEIQGWVVAVIRQYQGQA
ncbi:MAG: repressor LexA [Anaerolineae bacterium]|nr:repressor LexA [Anaerolineae bacterium]